MSFKDSMTAEHLDVGAVTKKRLDKIHEQMTGKKIRVAFCNSLACVKAAGRHARSGTPVRIEKKEAKGDFCPNCKASLEWRFKKYVQAK